MFTIADIYNIAIQIERNGEKEYQKAALTTQNSELKTLFTWMAQQEKKHADWFARLLENQPEQEGTQRELDEMSHSMLQGILKNSNFPIDGKALKSISSPLEALEFSIELEEETILFYEFIGNLVEDEKIKEELLEIIAEERNHITTLQNVLSREYA